MRGDVYSFSGVTRSPVFRSELRFFAEQCVTYTFMFFSISKASQKHLFSDFFQLKALALFPQPSFPSQTGLVSEQPAGHSFQCCLWPPLPFLSLKPVRALHTVRRRGSTPLTRMIEGLDHGQKTRPSCFRNLGELDPHPRKEHIMLLPR